MSWTVRKLDGYKDYKDIPLNKLAELQKLISNQKLITVAEAGVWLKCSPHCIRQMIKNNTIVAVYPFGTSTVRIDVDKTKELINNKKQVKN